jgi:phospholipid/cholesterol/gamma-HCH transport system substrate-binding protein
METSAKYRLMGAFTLAACLGVFAFVYWLNHGGGLGERTVYQIRFAGPVPGLRPGAAVQFNGIRVGEVTDLHLDAATPQQVMVSIAIESATPVRADTQVSLDFQGLMGVTSVALKGGSPIAPRLTSSGGVPPLLVADAGAGADLTTTAREALRKLDGILGDNADAVRGTISNLNVFTGALAKNSGRIDGIVGGLERMTGGDAGKPPAQSFDLTAPREFPPATRPMTGVLAVAEPSAAIVLDSQKLVLRSASGARSPMAGPIQWGDALPKLVQARVVQAIENATSPESVGRLMDAITADRQLLMEVRTFELADGEPPTAMVEIAARIVGDGGRVLGARNFRAHAPASSPEGRAAASALDQAFGQVATALALWTRDVN